jgi:hypothetical protein
MVRIVEIAIEVSSLGYFGLGNVACILSVAQDMVKLMWLRMDLCPAFGS